MIRVLLADDHDAVRVGLAMILDTADDIEVAGQAIDGADALRQARSLRPDVILMDVRMPTVDGLTATASVVAERLAPVIVLTTYDLDEYVFAALRAGAAGFLLKSVTADRLIEAVRRVAAGDGMLDPAVTRRIVETFVARPGGPAAEADPLPATLDELTDREREVLQALGSGLSNAEIAEVLMIGLTTVKTHVSRVLGKLGLSSRVQAALLARRLDRPPPGPPPSG